MTEPTVIDLLTGKPPVDAWTSAREKAERIRLPGACRSCWGDFVGMWDGQRVYVRHHADCPVRVRERRLEEAAERQARNGTGHAFGDCHLGCGCQDSDSGPAAFDSGRQYDRDPSSLVEQSNAREHGYLGGPD